MKNNKFKRFSIALVTALAVVACTDLEIEETDSFITSGFVGLENPASALEGLINNIGGNLADQANTYALHEVTTDAQLIPTRGADWGDNGRWRKLHQHEWGLEESDIITPFEQWTKTQLDASQIIDERSAATPDDVAAARFIRAFSMWQTLDLFGQVPFRDTSLPSTEVPEVLSGIDAVNFIIADLDLAISSLPNTAAGAGDDLKSPSASAAKFLKARVLLNKHVYENQLAGGGGSAAGADMATVISLVDEITANGYELQAGYFDIFLPEADSETIWFTQSSVQNLIYAPTHPNMWGLGGGGGWNGFSTLAEYYDLFEGDSEQNRVELDLTRLDGQEERRGGVPAQGLPFTGTSGKDPVDGPGGPYEWGSNVGYGFLINQQYDLDGNTLKDRQGFDLQFKRDFTDATGATNLINNNEQTGVRILKYNPRNGEAIQHKIQFRYADAHLMKAEAVMRSGGDATALVNELRVIREASPLGAVSERDILDERGRELYTEMVRRTDLIRFGQYLRDWEFKVPGAVENTTRLLFPIPLPQILANPNIVQNPGYN